MVIDERNKPGNNSARYNNWQVLWKTSSRPVFDKFFAKLVLTMKMSDLTPAARSISSLTEVESDTYLGAWTAIADCPNRLWHCGQLKHNQSLPSYAVGKTHILWSVTLTRRDCSPIKPLSTSSFLAPNRLFTTLWSFRLLCPSRRVLMKNALTSSIVTKGGSKSNTCSASSRIPCFAISAKAGANRIGREAFPFVDGGRRYKRRRRRKIPWGSGVSAKTFAQYLIQID